MRQHSSYTARPGRNTPDSVYEADAIFQTAMIQYERARYRESSRLFNLYLEKFPAGSSRDVASFLRDASDNPPAERERKTREMAARQTSGASIRVLVLERAPEVRVSASSSLEIRNPSGGSRPPDDQRPAGSPNPV